MRAQVIMAVAWIAASGMARADDTAAAKEHYRAGVREYDLLHYAEAVKEFEKAYQARPDPAFLFNMAQAHRLAGHREKAIGSYRSYLRRVPNARNRREVEERITELQGLIEQEFKLKRPSVTLGFSDRPASEDSTTKPGTPLVANPEPGAPSEPGTLSAAKPARSPTADARNRWKKIGGGLLLGVGGVLATVGITSGAIAISQRDQLTNPVPGTSFDSSLEDSFHTNRALAAAFVPIGSAMAVAGAVVFGLAMRETKHPVTLSPVVGPGRAGAVVRFRF